MKGKICYGIISVSQNITQIMKEDTKWEKVLLIPISNKGLIWNVLIILQINKKKTANSIFFFFKVEDFNRHFTKKHSKMAKKCMKGVQLP